MNRIERLSPKRAGESLPWVVARTVSIVAAIILATWAALSTSSLFKTDIALEITLACVVGLMFSGQEWISSTKSCRLSTSDYRHMQVASSLILPI
jgi:hypothetical protein